MLFNVFICLKTRMVDRFFSIFLSTARIIWKPNFLTFL